MRKWSLAAIVVSAALLGFHAAAGPLQISLTGPPNPDDDEELAKLIADTVALFIKNNNYPPSLALTNLSAVKVTQNATPPAGFPSFGAETLDIEIPFQDYNYMFMFWGSGTQGIGLLWLLDDQGSFRFESPNNEYLTFYSLYGPRNPAAVPESAPMALLLALGCGAVLTAARRSPRASAPCS